MTDEQVRLVIAEAEKWIGTPFKNCSDVRGFNGGVDCAMSLTRWHVDTGILPPFDPRPYPPQWFLHHDEERFVGWIVDRLRGREIPEEKIGCVAVFKHGRCFAHGALVVGKREIIHAYAEYGIVCRSSMEESTLKYERSGKPRAVRFFEVVPC